jgi:hypothetical protein
MTKSNLKAVSIRNTLYVILVLVIISAIVGFYFAQDRLSELAPNAVSSSPSQTATGAESVDQLKSYISNYQTIANKTNNITASSQEYQSQATTDINKYAANSNITIVNIEPTKTTPSTPASIAGTQMRYITVTMKNPVKYTGLMQFMKSVENNLPKMQITGIKLSRIANSNGNVNVDPIIIRLYTR